LYCTFLKEPRAGHWPLHRPQPAAAAIVVLQQPSTRALEQTWCICNYSSHCTDCFPSLQHKREEQEKGRGDGGEATRRWRWRRRRRLHCAPPPRRRRLGVPAAAVRRSSRRRQGNLSFSSALARRFLLLLVSDAFSLGQLFRSCSALQLLQMHVGFSATSTLNNWHLAVARACPSGRRRRRPRGPRARHPAALGTAAHRGS
jgi:hypothetical protein